MSGRKSGHMLGQNEALATWEKCLCKLPSVCCPTEHGKLRNECLLGKTGELYLPVSFRGKSGPCKAVLWH